LLIKENYDVRTRLLKDKYFIITSIINIFLFLKHTEILYGKYTFNPQFVYRTGGQINNFISKDNSILDFVTTNTINSLKILFSQEFGLFWFSPILFVGICLSILNIFLEFKTNNSLNILILSSYAIIFASVLLWRSTAASYGFRYLFCLIPISIILFFRFQSKYSFNLLKYYLIIFSIFATGSLLFFETTAGTQLSLIETTNTFGRSLKYTQPFYLQGYLNSFTELNSYLKIFTTSFLGAITFKLILKFFDQNEFIFLLESYGLPVDNEDFINYLVEIRDIKIHKFLFILFVCLFIAHFFTKTISKK